MTRYFHQTKDRKYQVIPKIKEMVNFRCLSLTGDDIFSVNRNKMDIIFCRNVLMYFTNEWIKRISQNLFHSLTEDGWLVVSSSELSSAVFPQFSQVNFPGAILYTKSRKKSKHSFDVHDMEMPEPLHAFNNSTFQAFQPPSALFEPSQLIHSPKASTLQSVQSYKKPREDTITKMIHAIRILADKGHHTEALSSCNEAIARYKLVTELYLLRAAIFQELGRSPEAIRSLKQAIYIDQNFLMGHYILGNLFLREGNLKNAKRCFKNVLELLNTRSNDDISDEFEGISSKYIRDIILNYLQA